MKKRRIQPTGFGSVRYETIVFTDEGKFATIPFSCPAGPQSRERAEATAILLMSALQEPENDGCWERLTKALDVDREVLQAVAKELGGDFRVELLDSQGWKFNEFHSHDRVMRLTEGNIEGLKSIGVDEIDEFVEIAS